jgi:hypothetical protein
MIAAEQRARNTAFEAMKIQTDKALRSLAAQELDPAAQQIVPELIRLNQEAFAATVTSAGVATMPQGKEVSSGIAFVPLLDSNEKVAVDPALLKPTAEALQATADRIGTTPDNLARWANPLVDANRTPVSLELTDPGHLMYTAVSSIFGKTNKHRFGLPLTNYGTHTRPIVVFNAAEETPAVIQGAAGVHELTHIHDLAADARDISDQQAWKAHQKQSPKAPTPALAQQRENMFLGHQERNRQAATESNAYYLTAKALGPDAAHQFADNGAVQVTADVEQLRQELNDPARPLTPTPAFVQAMDEYGYLR